jgi:hypothetical protein
MSPRLIRRSCDADRRGRVSAPRPTGSPKHMHQPLPDDGEQAAMAIAVMRAPHEAGMARSRLQQAGIAPADIGVDYSADRSDPNSEIEDAFISPHAASGRPMEPARAMLATGIPASVSLAVSMLPLMMWAAPGLAHWFKIVLTLTIATGATIALGAGADAAQRRAAGVGWTVRVSAATPEALEILRSFEPIRLDVVLDDEGPSSYNTPSDNAVDEVADHPVRFTRERLIHHPLQVIERAVAEARRRQTKV